jgi:beta-fructofuranosidase
MYDKNTKTYHVFYQSFPQHVEFGNTSWSHAVSADGMVTWTDVSDWRNRSMVAISPFSISCKGLARRLQWWCATVNLHGQSNGNLTLIYTGETRTADNWNVPYANHIEAQFIATSSNGGKTWQKYADNPFLYEAGNWNITGWRDPILQGYPELDIILGHPEPHYYMTFGSGIRAQEGPNYNHSEDAGPRIPLYTASARDFTNWTLQGALFELPQNFSFGGDAAKLETGGITSR